MLCAVALRILIERKMVVNMFALILIKISGCKVVASQRMDGYDKRKNPFSEWGKRKAGCQDVAVSYCRGVVLSKQ
jgi:hypothetical protein